MALVERRRLIEQIAPPIDKLLAVQLIDEFVSAERRYIQRDWEPSQLDGGQFVEVVARILYHLDSGNLNLNKPFDDCARYIENDQVTHLLVPRSDALHIIRVARTIYKFRSQRGAVHISPTYKPNHMDSKLVMECVRWVMNDTLRLFWKGDRDTLARSIKELLQFDVPAIGVFGDKWLVQRVDLTVDEEVLLLAHYAGDDGLSRTMIGRTIPVAAPRITEAVQRLAAPTSRQIVQLANGHYRLTDLGSKRVRETLADKLTTS